MNRKAFNPAGCLGFSYNGYQDQVIEQSKMNVQRKALPSSGSLRCQLIKGNKNTNFNFLQMIDVEDELRLSSMLSLSKKRTGIAAVLSHPDCINDHTRFLYYSWIYQTEGFYKKNARIQDIIGSNNPRKNATHIITTVSFGIDLVVVLKLPSETRIIDKIDRKLEQIRGALLKGKNSIFELTSDEKDLFKNVSRTTVYSNVPTLTALSEISDIIRQINTMKRNYSYYPPVTYTLQPITLFYPTNMISSVKFNPLPTGIRDHLEQYIIRVRNNMKYVEASLNESLPKLLCGHLQQQLAAVHNQCSKLKEMFRGKLRGFFTLVSNVRHGQNEVVQEIDQTLRDDEAVAIENEIDKLLRYIDVLKEKGKMITKLRQNKFEYLNIADSNLRKYDDLKTIEWVLINNDPRNRAFCSNDALNRKYQLKPIELCQILIKEHDKNPILRLIYLDFSYTSFPLHDILILPSDKRDHSGNYTEPKTLSPINVERSPPKLSSSPTPKFPQDEVVNILLLGETGVGKSTFINAFANYLTFSSLEQAQSHEPIVLIPVSFIMTVGDDFEEQTIKFGEYDSSDNEDFNTVGQSVTQHCKSYVFDLNENGQKLRIIDTPGFGDTRGLDQDDRNMEHILQYISNLTHLNAICFLLKPNTSRLNMFFRTCLTQLFSFLAPPARKNIIFCFTNGRSTFYTPGDTAPLLKAMLKSLSISDISFEKENTFCFDSESFRYLVALQNDVSFKKEDKQEYQTSWSTSVKESNRLVDHINKNLRPYEKGSGWQSIKAAQFEISYMVRPILETMRNILRNQTIRKNNLLNQFIELSAKAVHHTATRCLSCKPEPHQIGKFWVLPTVLHEIQDKCCLCACPVDQHVPIDYMLEYQCLYDASDHHKEATNNILEILCSASAEFAHFLMLTAHSLKVDPFLIGLKEMIHEENQICQSQKFSNFNSYLVKKLAIVQELYETRKQKIAERKSHQAPIDLPAIYRSIDNIAKHSTVHEQMVAVKQSQQMMMEDYEYEVHAI